MMIYRTRLAIFLVSLSLVGLELALMRVLSLSYWHHFASMVISIALLGLGFSGTLLFALRKTCEARRQLCLALSAYAFSWSVLLSHWAVRKVPLDMYQLAWNLTGEWFHILIIEIILLIPFTFAGGLVGLALMDRREYIGGHYAANLTGSGAGALIAILLMFLMDIPELIMVMAILGYLAGALLSPWKQARMTLTGVCAGVGLFFLCLLLPPVITLSPYKKLAIEKTKPGTDVLYQAWGPLGQIDVVKGPSIHDAPPGMSLQNPHPIPPRILLMVDGSQTDIIYRINEDSDRDFLDWTTGVLPYYMVAHPTVLIIGAGGGGAIAQAYHHQSADIVALELNPQITRLMKGLLRDYGGSIYNAPGVVTRDEEPRGYLASKKKSFDIIQIPLLDIPGESMTGAQATGESYLYTIDSFGALFEHLSERGILCVTRYAQVPPREGLRIFDMAVQMLKSKDISPVSRLALIRSWETVTLLVSRQPWTPEQLVFIRDFCLSRGFDLCYLPGLNPSEVNRFHIMEQPLYFEGAMALLGPGREAFIDDYLFNVEAPTDDRPYFFNFLSLRHLPELKRQLKGRFPAFMELGSLLQVVALLQSLILSAVMLFLPLIPGVRACKDIRGRRAGILYFFFLGTGFMLLEMGFMQKLILYLSHPIYSAAVVIAGFLIFAGLGSGISGLWHGKPIRVLRMTIVFMLIIILLSALGGQKLLDATGALALPLRVVVSLFMIAPLALAMGHLFPMGLRRLRMNAPAMLPWAWAVNGFASVIATVSAPLLAMSIGFSRLIILAVMCYIAAGFLFSCLPESTSGGLEKS